MPNICPWKSLCWQRQYAAALALTPWAVQRQIGLVQFVVTLPKNPRQEKLPSLRLSFWQWHVTKVKKTLWYTQVVKMLPSYVLIPALVEYKNLEKLEKRFLGPNILPSQGRWTVVRCQDRSAWREQRYSEKILYDSYRTLTRGLHSIHTIICPSTSDLLSRIV